MLKKETLFLYLFVLPVSLVIFSAEFSQATDLYLEPQALLLIKRFSFVPFSLILTYLLIRARDLISLNHNIYWIKSLTKEKLNLNKDKNYLWIILASASGLFLELLIIRLHSSYFPLFAFLKNFSLLSSFLGFGVGFALTRGKKSLAFLIAPLFTLQILLFESASVTSLQGILQNPISERYAMGLAQSASVGQLIFTYIFIAAIYLFNALCFVPVGQMISSLMQRQEKLKAYSWNLLGSLLGILIFTLLSYLWTPPLVWIIVGFSMLAMLFSKSTKAIVSILISIFIIVVFLSLPKSIIGTTIYSPYQVISLVRHRDQITEITANKTYFQQMNNYSFKDGKFKHYDIPYIVNSNPNNVLVVGSGTGNDVAAGLINGAKSIDAVEIDPVILKIGEQLHPEDPYGSRNVNTIVDDARNYIRTTNKRYDIIAYGHLDSHTLLSGKSSVRLDSYVYTVEAFKEARNLLKPNGVISLSFATKNPQAIKKLFLMLKEAFDGIEPGVYVSAGTNFLIGNNLDISTIVIPAEVVDISSEVARSEVDADMSKDDWPFLYMPTRTYPYSLVVVLMFLLVLTFVFVYKLIPNASGGVSLTPFLLGAGFMLIETKSITELALYYGSTWVVTAVTISAILILAMISNYYVMKKSPKNSNLYYVLLLAFIVLSYLFVSGSISIETLATSKLFITSLLVMPILFSGIAFSKELKRSKSIAIVLSSNLLGAMLGGFLEYNSMYFGFKFLYILAFFVYLFAFFFSKIDYKKQIVKLRR